MGISESELPNVRIINIGSRRNPLEIIEARIVLEAWDGYLYKHMENGREITDKKVTLYFECFRGNNAEDCRTELNAYNYLLKNQSQIRDSILKALTEQVNRLTQYLDPNDSFVPNIKLDAKTDFDFKPLIGPLTINFHEEENKNDIAYLEWHFQCEWDPEHGFAVITHEARVIDLDQDTDIWKIYEDNGTLAEKQKEYDERAKHFKPLPPPKRQKPWWEFW